MRDASTDDVLFFDVVAKSASLTEAARQIGTSVSSVSKRLSRIEKRLGVSLMLRTTRRLTLTSEGERYAAGSAVIAAELTELEDSLSEHGEPGRPHPRARQRRPRPSPHRAAGGPVL